MVGTKICKICNIQKPLTDFRARSDRPNHPFGSSCKACHAEREKNRYQAKREEILNARKSLSPEKIIELNSIRRERSDPKKKRATTLRSRYGISVEQYDAMLKDQNGVCAICKCSETRVDYRTGEVQFMPVDHDSITGQIRGLLCNKCNVGIGVLDHNLNRLKSAICYLEAHAASDLEKDRA